MQKQKEGNGSVSPERRLASLGSVDDSSTVSSQSVLDEGGESPTSDERFTTPTPLLQGKKKQSLQAREQETREKERQLLRREREKKSEERERRAERRKQDKEELLEKRRKQTRLVMDATQFNTLMGRFEQMMSTKQHGGVDVKLLPKPFAGKLDENVYQFINVCQRTSDRMFGQGNRNSFLKLFPGLLTDSAQAWYTSHNIEQLETWEEVKTAFLRYFDRLTESEKVALQYQPMPKHQKIEDFIRDFDARMVKLNVQPGEALKNFISTLTPYYRSRVSYEPLPIDLAEAQRRAITAKGEIEDIQYMINHGDTNIRALTDTLKTLADNANKNKVGAAANAATPETVCYKCNQKGHFQVNCPSAPKKPFNTGPGRGRFDPNFGRRNNSAGGGKFKSSFNRRPGGQSQPRNGIKCHRCGRIGHFKANCRVNLSGGRSRFTPMSGYSPTFSTGSQTHASAGSTPTLCYMTPPTPALMAPERPAIKAPEQGNSATPAPSTAPCYVMYPHARN